MQSYQDWVKKVKDLPATVLAVKSWKVQDRLLTKEDKAMFRGLYGIQTEYDLIELMIDIAGTIYEVSQFGFSK